MSSQLNISFHRSNHQEESDFLISTSFIHCHVHESIIKKHFKMLETMMNGKWKVEKKENLTIFEFDSESEKEIFGLMEEQKKQLLMKCLLSNIYKKEGEKVEESQFLIEYDFLTCFYNLANYLGADDLCSYLILEQDIFPPTVKLFLYKLWKLDIPEKIRISWLFKVETLSDCEFGELPVEAIDQLMDDDLISLSSKIKIYVNHVSKNGAENYVKIAEKIKKLYESCRNLLVNDNFDSTIQDYLLEYHDIFKERTQVEDANDTQLFETETFIHYFSIFLELDSTDDEPYPLLTKLKLNLEQHDSDSIYWWYFKFQNSLPDNFNVRFYCTCDNTDLFINDWIEKLNPIHLKDYSKPQTIDTDQGFESFDGESYITLHSLIVIEKENPNKRNHANLPINDNDNELNSLSKKQKSD